VSSIPLADARGSEALLDTRSKIIASEQVSEKLAARPSRWLTGSFDPLLAEHVRRLRQYATPGQLLVVEITNPAKPLLPQRARAELVAALAIVDFVVLKNDAATSQTADDASITERFIDHVLRRHRAEGAA
jgi:bifunctional ADP-heptose synthase (sugar kinase/adenylyltransferase)